MSEMTKSLDEIEEISLTDSNFNKVIGCIEDMFVSDEFLEKQKCFKEKYWTIFEDNEENKLEYMIVFKEYQNENEEFIENYLKKSFENFDMNIFIEELQDRKEQLHGEIFEELFTLTDFMFFKEMLLDYKAMKEGRTIDFTKEISVTKLELL